MRTNNLKKKLAEAHRILYKLGLCDYAGSVSVRIPETNKLLIRGAELETNLPLITADEIVKMNLDGTKLEGKKPPANEAPLHTSIYRARSDVGSVAHTHPLIATAFSVVDKDILPVFVRGVDIAAKGVPVFKNPHPICTNELGQQVAETLGPHQACLLKSHGLVTVGKTLEEACLAAINLEHTAKIQLLASLLGTIQPLCVEDIQKREERSKKIVDKVWHYYKCLLSL